LKIHSSLAGLTLCCTLAASTLALAQAAKPEMPPVGTKMSPSETYSKLLGGFEKEIVDAAEAMPEDKFNFAPTQGEFKGVRSFAGQVKHVAQANYYFWGSFAGSGPEGGASIDKLTSKADIVKALKDSFALPHKAIDSMTMDNAFVMTKSGTLAGMSSFGLAHMMDHYGQMVEYLRMNGIVPPASRASM
jgi:uncharacterized damage-inducible protein DinB